MVEVSRRWVRNVGGRSVEANPVGAARIAAQVVGEAIGPPGEYALSSFPAGEFFEFCENLQIITRDKGLAPLRLLCSQRYLVEQISAGLEAGVADFKILKSRQQGVTTVLVALCLFWMFRHEGLCAGFIIHEDVARERFRQIVNGFFANLPVAFRVPRKVENRMMLSLKNGSSMVYLTAGVKEKKSGIGRSTSFNMLLASEVAFYGTPDDLKQLASTLSQRYHHRLYLYEGTANGFNHWADMCDAAKSAPGQRFIFIGWWLNELNRLEKGSPLYAAYMPGGDAEPLSRFEQRKILEVKRDFGFEIGLEQIAWYRWHLAEMAGRDQTVMDQEHPWVPDDAFVATGSKYFASGILTEITRRARRVPFMPYKYDFGNQWTETEVRSSPAANCDLKIWQKPVKGAKYVIACDPAFGSSDLADRTVISVWRCFADRIGQAAEFASSQIATYQCAWVLAHLAGYYGDALVILEITGPGYTVDAEIRRLRAQMVQQPGAGENELLANMRSFIYRKGDSVRGSGGAWHMKMSHDVQWMIYSGFRDSVDTKRTVINSVGLCDEMRNIRIQDGRIAAGSHAKDDRVISAAYADHGWKNAIQPQMIAEGRTYEREMNPDIRPPTVTESAVLNYLKGMKIVMPQAHVPKPSKGKFFYGHT